MYAGASVNSDVDRPPPICVVLIFTLCDADTLFLFLIQVMVIPSDDVVLKVQLSKTSVSPLK